MEAVTHLEKVITGEVSAVTHLERVITEEATAVTYTEKVIVGEAVPITHLQKVIAGLTSPVTHLEHIWAGGSPTPSEHEYTGAVPVTFIADGTPLLDYLISGNMVQDSVPTPENPITPSECGDRTGNLFDGDYQKAILSVSGSSVTYYTGSSGRVAVISCSPSTQYTAKKYGEANRFIIAESETKPSGGDTLSLIISNSALVEYTFTTGANTHYVAIYVSTSSEQAEPPLMLNTGSTALPYEPYGYKLPITSGNTTTPIYLSEPLRKIGEYADSVQADGTVTRYVKKLVLTGEDDENWTAVTISTNDSIFRLDVSDYPLSGVAPVSTHYTGSTADLWRDVANNEVTTSIRNIHTVAIHHSGLSGVADWKSYLAQQYANGTPVTVWYALATPTSESIEAPTIPTVRGSQTFDVETTLKPSEVYIKYQG